MDRGRRAAGEPYTGEEWAFYTGGGRPSAEPGERLYIVAWGLLRGYAPVVRVERTARGWAIVRAGEAVAVTLPTQGAYEAPGRQPIHGFQGWRTRWWPREIEVPFPAWKTAGVG